MTCEKLNQILSTGSLIRGCDGFPVQAGPIPVLRIQTLFRYPGGEYVDLFWRATADGTSGELTDFGQTMTHLLSMGVDADATLRRKEFIADVCQDLNVERRNGELVADFEETGQEMLASFLKLGQACVRIADLFITHRTRLISVFGEDLEEGLVTIGKPFRSSVALTGIAGRTISLDYVVDGKSKKSGILSMSAKNTARAHEIAVDTFTKWYDLLDYQPDYQFITVVDSSKIENFKDSDLDRLESFSSVIPYPEGADLLVNVLDA